MVECALVEVCSGCPRIGTPHSEQLARKRAELRSLWREAGLDPSALGELPIEVVAAHGLRDRVDLSLRAGAAGPILGLHDRAREGVIDIPSCPALSPALARWHDLLRRDLPPLESAALRLRVAPSGERGLWIDGRREALEELVRDGAWVARMAAVARVELGQRHRSARREGASVRVGDPVLRPWSRTWIEDGARPVEVFSTAGGFTQVGDAGNRALVAAVRAAVVAIGARRWLELGAGCGNLTLPVADVAAEVVAVELDRLCRDGLARGVAAAGLAGRVRPLAGNLRRPAELAEAFAGADAVVADPPRSGLQESVAAFAAPGPRALVYVSCAAPALASDAARLDASGWRLADIRGVDLFPQTRHMEWVARFTRS